MWGATPVTASVAETVTARTGVRWLPAYGASELPVIACNPVDRPDEWRLDSAGLPGPEVELRVVDLDTGAVLEPGGIGEIQARSPSLMKGYLPEEANDDAFVDGWYRTGDVGWLEPEGWVHLTDRSKEMIKVKGFQVAPAEVEAVLHGHPAVVDCAVFGIADEQAGEVPVAAVQLDPDAAGRRRRAPAARGRLARHLQAAAPRRRRRRDPAPALGQGAPPHAPRRVGAAARRAGRLMDVRLSPSSAPCATRPCSSSAASARPPWPALDDEERRAKLDAAVDAAGLARAARRRLTTARRGRPASRWRSSPRSSPTASPTRRSSARRWPPTCAAGRARRRPRPGRRSG